jgi:hypothetical protein
MLYRLQEHNRITKECVSQSFELEGCKVTVHYPKDSNLRVAHEIGTILLSAYPPPKSAEF